MISRSARDGMWFNGAGNSLLRTPSHPTAAVPILTYHSLDASGAVISIAPASFRRQMQALHQWGYRGIGLSTWLDAQDGSSALPPRPVVLTFDDGFANLLDHGAPVLEELGFRATLFVVAGHCGGKNDWPSQDPHVPRLPLLTWSDLGCLSVRGFEIGAHTMTHPLLPRLTAAETAREVRGSQRILQDRLGQAVRTFAYPYGVASRMGRDLVQACFSAACGTDLGLAHPADDRCRLPRIDMDCFRNALVFRLFPTFLGTAYLRFRRFGRRCRARLAQWGMVPRRTQDAVREVES